MKTAYTCFCTDVIHEGHLNIINEAKKEEESLSAAFQMLLPSVTTNSLRSARKRD